MNILENKLFKKPREYKKGDRIPVQAQQIWQILVSLLIANEHKKQRNGKVEKVIITYGEVAVLMGNDPRAGHQLGRQLWVIGEYCKAVGLPTLNSIVVRQDTERPGDGVILSDNNTDLEEITDVNQYAWSKIGQPTVGTMRNVWEIINQ